MPERAVSTARRIAWALLLLLLPITSMPLVRTLVHSSAVASPSILPAAFLALIWLLPFLARRGKLPVQSLPLFGFALAAIVSSAAAFALPLPAFKDTGVLGQEITSFITLLVGLAFFLVTSTYVRDSEALKFSIRWINWGGLLLILWSLAQAYFWFRYNRYPDWMRDFQDLISTGPLYRQRVTGFAVEPSWLAHQLNMLYLPLWLAATVRGASAHRRLLGISVENLLLAGGVGVLALSFSRVGWLAFLLTVTFLFLRLNLWLIRRLRAWLAARRTITPARQTLLSAGMIAILLVVYMGGLLGGLYVFSKVDRRMEGVFQLSFWTEGSFTTYANKLQFGERVNYWQSGWEVFNDYPLLGVGLGNVGFFFPEKMPPAGWRMIEVRNLIYRGSTLLNAKNLWVRLLSETGLLGFGFFAAWLTLMLASAQALTGRPKPLLQAVGFAGIFVLIGLLLEGFSIDSFAMPYFWISFGLVTAAARMAPGLSTGQGTVQQ